MLATEVNNALTLLQQNSRFWFGKYSMHSLLCNRRPVQITLNYEDDLSLGRGVGLLLGSGHSPLSLRLEDDGMTFRIDEQRVVLRKKKTTFITDFDSLGYDPKSKELYYEGQSLSEELLAKFAQKRCTLTFDPWAKQDNSELWVERRQAMLSYIKWGWTLLDSKGNELIFHALDESKSMLDPNSVWVILISTPVVAQVEPEKLTIEGFRQEIEAVVAKYADLFLSK